MARSCVNDRERIKCLCTRRLNGLSHLLKTVKAHIFRHDFAESYVTWIYHGETEVQTTNVYRQNEGAGMDDEMMDVMDDVISDEHAGTGTDGYYEKLFEALPSELYPRV
ncbi:Transpos assoc domain-containing protein [Abeliophyllum distichum]|uniref:Transpos assoc domain-containing protein n=1 Tax=Abeliophyllum distichum TaxID=126358 RepID=A0ABD1RE58_9LAMI